MTDINGIFDDQGYYVFRNFTHFLAVYGAAASEFTEPIDFNHLSRDVIYSEAILSPDFCGQVQLGLWREFLSAIQEAAQEAGKNYGIVMKGIVTCICYFGLGKAKKAALCAA